ncbi:MAG TPA: 4-hydroxy-tetrahydrodipicolinate synthase [Candidatus Acidoferrum sp.]|jgi:4-hydroxy-2-oxoglutarate aldolase|nr:4-hydroxy-tetrahydrodipicolinate synthase [Candidatus Acidoferrum sp.]
MTISGIFPALVTPFEPDGAVSLRGVRENIRRYNQTAVAGCVVLGSTGESVMLSREAADSVLAASIEVAAPSKLLIAGTGAESTSETIARTRRAADLGYAAALVKTPYYYKPVYKAETFIRHYRAVADASPIPVLLYSVPQFTGITLETPEILTLAAHPNIVGIKDSSGNIQRAAEIVAGARPDFQVLTGGAAVIYPALAVGARGAILALAAALPEKCAELFLLFESGRHEQAKALQLELAVASKRIVSEQGIAGVKYAMDLRGYNGGLPSLPLLPLAEEKKQSIAAVISQLHPVDARV